MWLGALLLAAALALFLYNQAENRAAGTAAAKATEQLRQMIPAQPVEKPLVVPNENGAKGSSVMELDGKRYIGLLSIPTQGLELPIAADWDYTTLKSVPCRYSGSLDTDDLTICGHNYRLHFGPLYNLRPGDKLAFTTVEGEKTVFVVKAVEILQPNDIENMTVSGFPLTLFTCTYSGQTRLAVRCDRAD